MSDTGAEYLDGTNESSEKVVLGFIPFALLVTILGTNAEIISMIGIGCGLRLKDFEDKRLPTGLTIGLALQTLLQPFIGYLIAKHSGADEMGAYSILLIASAPIGSFNSVLTYWANSHICLSVLLSVYSTALAVGMMPLWFFMYGAFWGDGFVIALPMDIAFTLFKTIPFIGFGMVIKRYKPNLAAFCFSTFPLFFLCTVALDLVVALLFDFDSLRIPGYLWFSLLILPVFGYIMGMVMALILRLPWEWCVPMSLGLGAGNGQLAFRVLFNNSSSIGPAEFTKAVAKVPHLYAILSPSIGLVFSLAFKSFGNFANRRPDLFSSKFMSKQISS